MRGHRAQAFMATVAALLVCAACSGGGPKTAPGGPPTGTTATGLTLTRGQGFDRSGAFVRLMTCDDPRDYSPGLNFAHVPAGTAELAVSMVDLDAHKIHWLQLGIPADAHGLTAHHLTPGAREALNDFGEATYDGPCPPHGTTHHYQLTLYALRERTPASLNAKTPPAQTLRELQHRAVASATLVAPYTRR
ncbi:YbhB/YbcL family Raf kinase inhibitor-like protein [Streptomyces sp. RPT161]|uniref:YbhB/YbcL family Raf kinase inhibitor-like protein n=1 Tax=Streptomyces sp. RPT161 TaxID=3015993 RepID=UPI0022B89D31|nr:YbhB/YbcL family Raf kinase inhibitor-like protein [Streptomyces sp. RPT161]